MNEKQKIIDIIIEKQKSGELKRCPKCGIDRMDPTLERNALSRRADVYICSLCGTIEAYEDFDTHSTNGGITYDCTTWESYKELAGVKKEDAPEVNDEVDKENRKQFCVQTMTSINPFRFRCVLCGEKVSLDSSFSNKGRHLVCTSCLRRRFRGSYVEMFYFIIGD